MPQLTLRFPAGLAPHELQRLARHIEREYGCQARPCALDDIDAIVALDVVLAMAQLSTRKLGSLERDADASIRRVRALRDTLREGLR